MVLKSKETPNNSKRRYNMDMRIAKNLPEISQSHNGFGEFE